MAEPFKNFLDATVVATMGAALARAAPGFDRTRFERLALDGLAALELKARAQHLCSALEATLPGDFDAAATVLQAAMAGEAGLRGWALWPVGEYVARHGQGQPGRALALLKMLTPRFTAEWAIRPFIERHPALTYATLHRWAGDPDEHVRRLVSEGTRPRLPWGLQLRELIADPSPNEPLLERLLDDPSPYVRRSVANHLNDIAKDHPARVAAWIERHRPEAPPERQQLLRHAARTLIKAGDPRVLAAFGLGRPFRGTVAFAVSPARIVLGEAITLRVALQAAGRGVQPLEIDYAVHHVKAAGHRSAKVFKGWRLALGAGQACERVKRHAVRAITTRRYHAGLHVVDLRINGRVVAEAAFELVMPAREAEAGGAAGSVSAAAPSSPRRRSRR